MRHANSKYGPARARKHDVKDGFYRLFLALRDCLRLALLLPRYENEPQLIGIPMACTMGWVQSPPTFCTMSETICDRANQITQEQGSSSEHHRLDTRVTGDDFDRSMQP